MVGRVIHKTNNTWENKGMDLVVGETSLGKGRGFKVCIGKKGLPFDQSIWHRKVRTRFRPNWLIALRYKRVRKRALRLLHKLKAIGDINSI